jgi:transketolase
MGLAHLATVLLYESMRWDPAAGSNPDADALVISGRHASHIIDAVESDIGATVRDVTHIAPGTPGRGLAIATGLSLDARERKSPRRVFCIMGDGETREGAVWEACDLAVERSLTNLVPIVACNQSGQSGATGPGQSAAALTKKLGAFGWTCVTIDGHDPAQIRQALADAAQSAAKGAFTAIIARTTKGWGSSSLQAGSWHGRAPAGDRLKQAKSELDAMRVRYTSALASAGHFRRQAPGQARAAAAGTAASAASEALGTATASASTASATIPNFAQAMRAADMGTVLAAGKLSTRRAFGLALRTLAQADRRIWSLDTDTRNATGADSVASDRMLSDRFVECRAGEQSMVGAAIGLASAGAIPFCSTYARFVSAAHGDIESAARSGANIKVIGSHAGIAGPATGTPEAALVDAAALRPLTTMSRDGIAAFHILQPADAWAAYGLTVAMAKHDGPCVMRTSDIESEFLYSEDTHFELGKFEVLTEGRDLLIVSAGAMIHECNRALDLLDLSGIDATIVDLYSIPFDRDALLDLANSNGGNILVVEDSAGGLLASAIAEACTDSGDAFTIGAMHVQSAVAAGNTAAALTHDDRLRAAGLHHSQIAARAAALLGVRA